MCRKRAYRNLHLCIGTENERVLILCFKECFYIDQTFVSSLEETQMMSTIINTTIPSPNLCGLLSMFNVVSLSSF